MKKLLSIALLTMSFAQPVLCMENNNNNNEFKKIVVSPEERESFNKLMSESMEKHYQEELNLACLFGNDKLALRMLKNLIKPHLDWNQAKIILIGHLKEDPKDCFFATLPIEMIHYLLPFCADKKQNISRLKKLFTTSSIIPFGGILDDIINPQSWADEKTAEKTYDKLIELINQMDEQNKNNK